MTDMVVIQLCDEDPEYVEVTLVEREQMPAFVRASLEDELLGKGVSRRASLDADEEAVIQEIIAALSTTARWRKGGYTYIAEPVQRWRSM